MKLSILFVFCICKANNWAKNQTNLAENLFFPLRTHRTCFLEVSDKVVFTIRITMLTADSYESTQPMNIKH